LKNYFNFILSDYYSKRKFLPEKSGFYVENQLIAVKSSVYNSWLRARVTTVFDDQDIDRRKLKVKSYSNVF